MHRGVVAYSAALSFYGVRMPKKRVFRCLLCGQAFTDIDDLVLHRKRDCKFKLTPTRRYGKRL